MHLDRESAVPCEAPLPGIGGDAVVSALADHWRRGRGDFRRRAAEIMGHIHADLSVEKLLDFFPREKDEDTKEFLASSLLDNFVPEAVDLCGKKYKKCCLHKDQA